MNRSIASSTLSSVVLHAAAFSALLVVRYDRPSDPGYSVIEVEWIGADDGADQGRPKAERARVEEAAAGTPSATAARPPAAAPEEPPARAEAPPPAAGAASTPRRSDPPDGATADDGRTATTLAPRRSAPPDAPSAAAAGERSRLPAAIPPASADTAADVVRSDGPAQPAVTARNVEPDAPRPAASIPAQREPARSEPAAMPSRPSAPKPSPQMTERMAAAEREVLTEKLEKWARRVDPEEPVEPLFFDHDGREYAAEFTHVPAADEMSVDEVVVTVTTERNGRRLATEMRFKRLAFSSFAQFVDRWDPAVHVHDDEIDGRFHSNAEIPIDDSRGVKPTFHGKVTTARGITRAGAAGLLGRAEIFQGGLETRVGKIALARRFSPFEGREAAERAHRFTVPTRIEFFADGSYGWRPLESSVPGQRRTMTDGMAYLVGSEDAELHVEGVVNGRVLVYSPEGIVIEGDLTYAGGPEAAGLDDYLGLVSDRNVEIAEPEVTGPGDVSVHAAIYAQHRFVVRRYRSSGRATLSIFGSVTAGSLSATEPRFRTKLRFDPRLLEARPPSFPLTDRYELATSLGAWTIEPL